MLTCDHIIKQYGKFRALNDISLSVSPGECLALFGSNGSGKSTLLSILAGSIPSDTGVVRLNDAPVSKSKRSIAYIPQNIVLFEELSVWENLLSWSEAPGSQAKKQAEWLCDCFDMHEFKRKRVDRLSGGQRRRVNIAVSFMNDFDYLLLDEPLSGVDLVGEKSLSELLSHYKQEGKGIIIAEHHIQFVLPFADHILELKEGSVHFEGTPEAYYEMVQSITV